MTDKPSFPAEATVTERRKRGFELADAWLTETRELAPLSGAAHARVKRRLLASTRRRSFRVGGWTRPVVVASLFLVCGAAFGVALDRVVLQHRDRNTTEPGDGGKVKPGRRRAPAPKATADSSPSGAWATVAASSTAEREASSAVSPASTSGASPDVESQPIRQVASVRRLALRKGPVEASVGRPSPGIPADLPAARLPAEWPALPAQVTQPPAEATPSPVLPAVRAVPSSGARPAKAVPGQQRLSEERLLAVAVRALRTDGDGPSALSALDEYRVAYPQGRLSVEAEVLRVDALLAMNDTAGALRVLDKLSVGEVPGGLARQLQRAELRASMGRHGEAEKDFADVLLRARSQDRELVERTLWRRAQSRAQRGDERGARLDAGEYLRTYPTGRFAAEAAQIVGRTGP